MIEARGGDIGAALMEKIIATAFNGIGSQRNNEGDLSRRQAGGDLTQRIASARPYVRAEAMCQWIRFYLVQTTGAFRQARGGGPISRCQTRPSSN
jgi:hypothetical protein